MFTRVLLCLKRVNADIVHCRLRQVILEVKTIAARFIVMYGG